MLITLIPSYNGVITGNGEYFDLRAAPQAQRKKKQRVGLFLSRVRPDFRCRDVVSHVRQVTGLTVRCEPIPTRYDTYRSYMCSWFAKRD